MSFLRDCCSVLYGRGGWEGHLAAEEVTDWGAIQRLCVLSIKHSPGVIPARLPGTSLNFPLLLHLLLSFHTCFLKTIILRGFRRSKINAGNQSDIFIMEVST